MIEIERSIGNLIQGRYKSNQKVKARYNKESFGIDWLCI